MIVNVAHGCGFGLGQRPRDVLGPRRLTVSILLDAAAGAVAAAPPVPRRVADGLEALLSDGAALAAPSPVLSAARAFGAGSGIIAGQIIDRAI